MKSKKNVIYFPVTSEEQAVLARIREPDLCDRLDALLDVLDHVAEGGVSAREWASALEVVRSAEATPTLEAKFQALEAKLVAAIESRLLPTVSSCQPPEVRDAPPVVGSGEDHATTTSRSGNPAGEASENPLQDASIAFRIEGEVVTGATAAAFYAGVWTWLWDHRRVREAELPIKTGSRRFAVAHQPIHPTGLAFSAGREFRPGIWVETHMSRRDVLRRAQKLLSDRGVAFQILLGDDEASSPPE
jgi:hypothetical protein